MAWFFICSCAQYNKTSKNDVLLRIGEKDQHIPRGRCFVSRNFVVDVVVVVVVRNHSGGMADFLVLPTS